MTETCRHCRCKPFRWLVNYTGQCAYWGTHLCRLSTGIDGWIRDKIRKGEKIYISGKK